MVRLRTPLLSMDAHGTIGNAVTFQSNTKRKFAREKPVLPYSLTLPQQYQRWLYEDYCAYWHTLTTTQKNVYRDAGHRFHRTAFQHFMSVMLATLPDIIGLWHLDYFSGGLAPDSSRNANTGTVFGASVVDGLIDHAFYFDGVNDRVSVPHSPSLNPLNAVSCSLFVSFATFIGSQPQPSPNFFEKGDGTGANRVLFLAVDRATRTLYWGINISYATFVLPDWPANSWHHIAGTYDRLFLRLYVDGQPVGVPFAQTMAIPYRALPLVFNLNTHLQGRQDHLVIYNRCITPSDILRHSKRRYQS